MIKLLNAIRDAIIASPIFSYIDNNVYIIPETDDVVFFPESYHCPCITLSDGGEDIINMQDSGKQTDLFVDVSSYNYLREPETALIGETDVKGVLEMTADLRGLLVFNLLGIANMNEAEVLRVGKSEPFKIWSQDDIAIKQKFTIKYTKFLF